MPKIAVKRLTKSDITIIARHFYARKAVGDRIAQKSIALNKRIFINRFFPTLPMAENATEPFTMTVIGPGGNPSFQAAATVTKTMRNWRLNGFFKDPANQDDDRNVPDRFSGMLPPPGHMEQDVEAYVRANNIAVIEFYGAEVPTGGRVAFVSRPLPGDELVFQRLSDFLGNRSMAEIDRDALAGIMQAALVPVGHPLRELTAAAVVEEPEPIEPIDEAAALGVGEAIRRIRAEGRGRRRRRVTAVQHALWRAAAELSGRWGEELAWHHLTDMENRGEIRNLVWSSVEEDFYSPFDFRAAEGRRRLFIEVKSTVNEFNTPINISIGELEEAASGRGRYAIYRIYNVSRDSGLLRICPDVGDFARTVLESLRAAHDLGVSVDKLSFLPELIGFEPEVHRVTLPEDPAEADDDQE